MTTMTDILDLNHLEPEMMPDYEGIRERFINGFQDFVMLKKCEAVEMALRQELPFAETLVQDPDFIQAIANRVEDEAIIEKPYVFVAMCPDFAQV